MNVMSFCEGIIACVNIGGPWEDRGFGIGEACREPGIGAK
jgi:hypothetical protein